MNCAQVKEQLVDFLYDDLPAGARAAFAEHLRGCPGCNAEVASYQTTLGQTRKALTGPLLEEPPARVHAAALAAANAAAQQARQRGDERAAGFLARFWRTPWILPAFGAVSVATAVFLVRVLKNPVAIPGQERRAIDERAVVTPLPSAPPALAPPAAEGAAAPSTVAAEGAKQAAGAKVGGRGSGRGREEKRVAAKSGARAEAPAFETAGKRKGLDLDAPLGGLHGSATAGGSGRFAEPPPPRPATNSRKSLDDLLGEVGSARKPAPAPAEGARETTEREARSRDLDELADYGQPPTAAKPAAKKAKAAEAIPEATHRPSGFAAPPPPMAAPAPAPAPSQPPMPAADSAPTRATVPVAKPARRQEAEETMAPAAYAAEPTEKPAAKDKAPAAKGGPSLDESVKKADRLFANGEWSAAAAAYRDLLNRFPTYKDARRWRERLDQSLVAVEEARKASDAKASKAAKAKSSDTLLKEMK